MVSDRIYFLGEEADHVTTLAGSNVLGKTR